MCIRDSLQSPPGRLPRGLGAGLQNGPMAPVELGLLTLAVLAWIAVGVVAVVAKAFHRDEVFTLSLIHI